MYNYVFLIWMLGLIIVSVSLSRTPVNLITVFFTPYLVIVLVNNWLMVGNGFYQISNQVINLLILSSLAIFCGWFASYSIIIKREGYSGWKYTAGRSGSILELYRLSMMTKYVLAVIILTAVRFGYVATSKGMIYIVSEEFSGALVRGPMGHIFLSAYPLIPILFYKWIKDKTRLGTAMLVLAYQILLFMTFVKYHIISLIVCTFLFVVLEERKYLKYGILIMITVSSVVFFSNYALTFFVRGVIGIIDNAYYVNHIWNYLAGSLIRDNEIFTIGVRVGTSTLFKIGTLLVAPINLLLAKLFDIKLFEYQSLVFSAVGNNDEVGNVVDAFGYLYPSKGSALDIVVYFLILVVVGFSFNAIFNGAMRKHRIPRLRVGISVFLTFFVFFSFFGTFYINFMPYELLLWGNAVPWFFHRSMVITVGRKSIVLQKKINIYQELDKLKVGIITFHGSHNFGSMLQAYATQQLFEQAGMETEIINYRIDDQQKYYSLYQFGYGSMRVMRNIFMLSLHDLRKKAWDRYERFISENMYLSGEELKSESDLEAVCDKYDIYVSGSDQIWGEAIPELKHSENRFSDAYFLDFVRKGKKVSFSTSIGEASEKWIVSKRDLINDFDLLSCREVSGVERIEKATGRYVETLPDPTLIIDEHSWITMAERNLL